jgi:hypothetical protein
LHGAGFGRKVARADPRRQRGVGMNANAAGARRANAVTACPGDGGIAMKIVRTLAVSAALALSMIGAPASAQDSSYTAGTVWNFSYITIEPGQFENYMDYLSKTWKKSQDYGLKEGDIVSYHVFQINNARAGEPDLILAVETKDYLTNAQQLAVQRKFEKFMAQDTHKLDAGMGERKVMRKLSGSMELQELKLK